jgi:hypothetical protein
MISLLIGILIIVVVGAICFWAIEKFAPRPETCKSSQVACSTRLSRRDCATIDGADVLAAPWLAELGAGAGCHRLFLLANIRRLVELGLRRRASDG